MIHTRIMGVKIGMYFNCRNAVSRNARNSLRDILVKFKINSAMERE